MNTGPNALGTTENVLGSAKKKRDPMPTVPPKTSSGTQNMKTGPGTRGTTTNKSGRSKHENGTRHPRYHEKYVSERKT
jgi:hypothetical protein